MQDGMPKAEISIATGKVHATAIPLLSTAMDDWEHYKVIAIKAVVNSLWVDIFPNGDDFSATHASPSTTNQPATDKGASKSRNINRYGYSYLQTMKNKGINPLIALQMALTGEIYKQG